MSWFKIKPKKNDYSLSDLPHTRKQEFFDIFKNRYDILLFFGLIYFIFAIPFAVIFFLSMVMEDQFYQLLINKSIDINMYQSEIILNTIYKDLLYLIGVLIFDLTIASSIRIYRKLCYQEPIILWGDILRGIKENYVSVLFTSLIMYLAFFIADVVKSFLPVDNQIWQVIIYYIPYALFALVIVPSSLFSFSSQAVYTDKWRKIFKNGYQFALYKYYISALFGALFTLPFLLLEIGLSWVSIIFYIFYFFLYLPVLQLAFTLYSFYVFDEKVNFDLFKGLYKKGLYVKENNHEKREDKKYE